MLTEYDIVKAAIESGEDQEVTLAAGMSLRASTAVEENGSAGGIDPNPDCGRPAEGDAILQAQGNHGQGGQAPDLYEFTSKPSVATGFGRREGCCVTVIKINTRYLSLGSVAEEGFACFRSAPVEFVGRHEFPREQRVNLTNAKTGKRIVAD